MLLVNSRSSQPDCSPHVAHTIFVWWWRCDGSYRHHHTSGSALTAL